MASRERGAVFGRSRAGWRRGLALRSLRNGTTPAPDATRGFLPPRDDDGHHGDPDRGFDLCPYPRPSRPVL